MFEVGQKLICKLDNVEVTVVEVNEDHIGVKEAGDLWYLPVYKDEYSDYEAA